MKLKIRVIILIFLAIFSFSLSDPILAQTVNPTESLILQLQEQVKLLQSQIEELRSQVSSTKTELELVKTELKFTKALKLGTRGDEVTQLQEFLKQFPDIYPQGLVTGYFGPLTESAVRKFQEKQGIESIGVVGPKTLSKLNELVTEGAGASGVVPPGLLIAPGVQNRLATTTVPTTPVVPATTTPIVATTTPAGATPATPATSATPAVAAQPAAITTSTTTIDTTPHVANTITIQDITSSRATFMWYSNEPAYAWVEYGTNPSYTYGNTISDPLLSNYHQEQLESLQSSTTYYYRVRLTDAAGNSSVTSNGPSFITSATTYTADTTPPVISGLGVAQVTLTTNSASIGWSTDEPADSTVEYGLTTSYGSSKYDSALITTPHDVNITGLTPSTMYHYRVKSKDTAGNTATSNDSTFWTFDAPTSATSTSSLAPRSQNLSAISQMLNSLDEILKQLSKILK